MGKENLVNSHVGETFGPVTRARAAAYRASREVYPWEVLVKHEQKKPLRTNSKRAASDEGSSISPATADLQHKKRVVLKDVTNDCKASFKKCINAAKLPRKGSRLGKKDCRKVSDMGPSLAVRFPQPSAEPNTTAAEGTMNNTFLTSQGMKLINAPPPLPSKVAARDATRKRYDWHNELKVSSDPEVTDIDSDSKDPFLCSLYATDIYRNFRLAELNRRPSSDFMETIQRDVTPSMRAILVDWLVEVSEEYKLVPDTLYHTVYLIDWFMSRNYIERRRLQLLGITCMLIASKYEELSAPSVDEFCSITDDTYTKEEVRNMELQVLKFMGFNISIPTTKTFLRRFLRAAQTSNEMDGLQLHFLANYLAELSLVDYAFLAFRPSLIAASAVFLAKWTTDPSSQPWNATLKHCTTYKASDMQTVVLALRELQLNTKLCPLDAVREKYRQDKFKAVAELSSEEPLPSLFVD